MRHMTTARSVYLKGMKAAYEMFHPTITQDRKKNDILIEVEDGRMTRAEARYVLGRPIWLDR